MFEGLGLNVARQADNGINPRPDNRSGWLDGETPDLDGETPDLVGEALAEPEPGLNIRLWDPSTQLRFHRKRAVPARPDGAANKRPSRAA
jgi:biotin synthase